MNFSRHLKFAVIAVLATGLWSSGAGLAQTADPAPVAASPEPVSPPTPAATTPATNLTPEQTQRVLELLNDPQKRAAFVESLQAVSKAVPPAAAATAAPTPSVPAAPPTTAPASKTTPHLKSNSVAGQLLLQASAWVRALSAQLAAMGQTMSDLPALSRWVVAQFDTPQERQSAIEAGWKLGLMFLAALAVEFALRRALKGPMQAVIAHSTSDTGRRSGPLETESAVSETRTRRSWYLLQGLPFVLLNLILALLPVAAFATVGNLLPGLDLIDSEDATIVFLAIVNAYAFIQFVLVFSDTLLAPQHPRLRIIPFSDTNAAYTAIWIRRLAIVTIAGLAAVEVGELLGMNADAHDALQKLVMLIVHICLVIIVLQNRVAVRDFIRRGWRGPGMMELLLGRFAAVWHFLAIAIIVGLWVVWAAELRDGYSRFLHFFLTTCGVIFVARLVGILALGGLDHTFRVRAEEAATSGLLLKVNRYYPLLRMAITVLLIFTALLALLQIWGVDALAWFAPNQLGSRILSVLLIVAITLLSAIVVWEMVSTAIDHHAERLQNSDQSVRLARIRTLQPILKTALLTVIFVMAALTILSEVGINIAPLLAGAGIVGVAVGFGSQKLVQDFITGIFLLMENAMQVGDQVTVAGLSGSVEHLSIRTIRLRAGDGSVHIIPFSSVTTVNNANRGKGNAAVVVNVSYREDTDRVGQVLKEIAAEMRAEPDFASGMTGDLDLWGVDKVEGSIVTIAGQIGCTDKARWGVQREFNRRMKKRFEELGIEIGIQTHAVTISKSEDDVSHKTPESGVATDPGDTTATVVDSPPPSALGNKE